MEEIKIAEMQIHFVYAYLFPKLKPGYKNKKYLPEEEFLENEKDIYSDRKIVVNSPFKEDRVEKDVAIPYPDTGRAVIFKYSIVRRIWESGATIFVIDLKSDDERLKKFPLSKEKNDEIRKIIRGLYNKFDEVIRGYIEETLRGKIFEEDEAELFRNEEPFSAESIYIDKMINIPFQLPYTMVELEVENYESNFKIYYINPVNNKEIQNISRLLLALLVLGYPPEDSSLSFAKSFTNYTNSENEVPIFVNMSTNDEVYCHLLGNTLLFIHAKPKDNKTKNWIDYLRIRLLDTLSVLQSTFVCLSVANQVIDNRIQKIKSDLSRQLFEKDIKKKLSKTEMKQLRKNILEFLNEWLREKEILLRVLEEPTYRKCAGISFEILLKEGTKYLGLQEMEKSVFSKVEKLDRLYDDLMDYMRLLTITLE